MKFYINQKYMDSCLSIMLRGINSQTPLNVLECVQITVNEDYIQFVTSDITTGTTSRKRTHKIDKF